MIARIASQLVARLPRRERRALVCSVDSRLGREIFPQVDTGQFQLRLRARTGTRIEGTEEIARAGPGCHRRGRPGPTQVEITVGYVGLIPSSLPDQRHLSVDSAARRRRSCASP